jgi:cytochrome c oxidase cbb3-type subunit 3
MRFAAAGCCLLALIACQRERRDLRPAPASEAVFGDAARLSQLQPGGTQSRPLVANPYQGSAYAVSEGQRLYAWYNCTGCHANGGGAIGPPLIKSAFLYGAEPANLFDTIVKGRPNGMPAWGGRVPEYQVWQLVAYVRSLNGLEPKSATPVRADTIEQDPHTLTPPHGGSPQ